MTQADSVHSTPPVDTYAIDQRSCAAAPKFLDMESDVEDVDDMASVCCLLMEKFSDEMAGVAKMDPRISAEDLVRHVEHWRSLLNFSIVHLREMASDLRRQYNEATDAEYDPAG